MSEKELKQKEAEEYQLNLVLKGIIELIKKYSSDPREISSALENYMKATISFVDTAVDTLVYEDQINDEYNSMYSALIEKKATSLGIARTVKYILDLLNIKANTYLLSRGNEGERILTYIVMAENCYIIDPVNSLIMDRTFCKKSAFYKDVQFIKLSDEFFKGKMDYFNEYSVEEKLKKNAF